MRISHWSSDVCSSDLLLPRGYRDNGRKTISLRELTRLRLLTLAPNSLFRNHLEDALRANGIAADLSYEFTHAGTLIAMVEAGLGAGILPRIAVPRTTARAVLASRGRRSEEHTSELQSLMRTSYAVFCLKKKKKNQHTTTPNP